MSDIDAPTLLTWLAIAVVAFLAGRASVSSDRPEPRDRVAERQRAEGHAREVWRKLSPQAKAQVDALLASRKVIEAVKVIRNETALGLKESKNVVDLRRRMPVD